MEMYHLLVAGLGHQNWWPGETRLEVMVGAVLTQNTNWKNVEKAIQNLKDMELLTLQGLKDITTEELSQVIRPAGYYNIKADRLKNLINFIETEYEGNLDLLFKEKTETLRQRFLSVRGIGPETADSILLYAAGRPVFVVDAYTHRILYRHGMVDDHADYHELQGLFTDHLPQDVNLYNEFHALIVNTGKNYCRKKPACPGCPLEQWMEAS